MAEALDTKPPQVWTAPEEAEQLKRFFAAAAFLYSCAISRQVITALAPRRLAVGFACSARFLAKIAPKHLIWVG